MLPAKT